MLQKIKIEKVTPPIKFELACLRVRLRDLRLFLSSTQNYVSPPSFAKLKLGGTTKVSLKLTPSSCMLSASGLRGGLY